MIKPNTKPIFIVSQLFSKQGQSIANQLIKQGKYHVKGITSRSIQDNPIAIKYLELGIELIQADFLKKEELLPIYKDAYGVFVVRPLISPVDPEANEKEFQSIKTQCDAAVEVGTIKHLIYSSTDSPIADKVQEYVNSISISYVSTFYLSFFFSNSIEFSRPIVKDDKSLVFAQPFPKEFKVPYCNPYIVTGIIVNEFLENPSKYNKCQIPIVTEFLSGEEFVKIFSQVTGVKAEYKSQTRDQYLEDNGFNVNPQMQYIGGIIHDIWVNGVMNPKAFKNATTEFTKKIDIPSRTWEEFLKTTKWKGESYQDFKLINNF